MPHSGKRGEREKLLSSLIKIICVRKRKKIREIFFFFSRETYTKIIVIDFCEIIRNLPHDFSLQRERVFYVNICIFVCDCYFRLLILLIILFET